MPKILSETSKNTSHVAILFSDLVNLFLTAFTTDNQIGCPGITNQNCYQEDQNLGVKFTTKQIS